MPKKKRYSILYVEDDPAQFRLVDILKMEGFDAVRADGVDECIKHLKRKRFDLLIADIMMAPQSLHKEVASPLETGMHLIRLVQEQPQGKGLKFKVPTDIPILVCSGVPSDTILDKCIKLVGRANVFVKGEGPEALIERVKALLEAPNTPSAGSVTRTRNRELK